MIDILIGNAVFTILNLYEYIVYYVLLILTYKRRTLCLFNIFLITSVIGEYFL